MVHSQKCSDPALAHFKLWKEAGLQRQKRREEREQIDVAETQILLNNECACSLDYLVEAVGKLKVTGKKLRTGILRHVPFYPERESLSKMLIRLVFQEYLA